VTVTATSEENPTQTASTTVYIVPAGLVTPTGNPLVAQYTIDPPASAQIYVQFGTNTTYGQVTSVLATPPGGGPTSTYVAGMRGSTAYHIRGVVQFNDGTQFFDQDQIFSTGPVPPTEIPQITVTTTPGMTPEPGIELLDLLGGTANIVASDLAGNVVWYYPFTASSGTVVQPVRFLPNGHFLVTLSPISSTVLKLPGPNSSLTDEIREIDLAGNIIRSINITQLNTRLAAAGFNLVAQVFHHDAIALPNGHWIVLTNTLQNFDNLSGFPGTTTVLGDVIVDLDTNLNPVWVWNTFDHLDVNRHPLSFPDWTHANALLYAQDGNLLLSMRNQNWIVKIDYANGAGAGDILWHLGQGGDFTLIGGTDPTDWPYAQHGPAFFSADASQTFDLGIMDNGDDRAFPGGETCSEAGFTVCPYSTVPIFQLDETAMTATLLFHDVLSQYSFFGGNVNPLANGDVEFDLCSDDTVTTGAAAVIYEVTRTNPPQVVFKMNINAVDAYRAYRLPSLYPVASN
jgi:arylsulfate sulfotransferase